MKQSAFKINREVCIRPTRVIAQKKALWVSTHTSFVNQWDTDLMDGAMVFKWGVKTAPMLDISFLHFWELRQPPSLLFFLGTGQEVEFEA